MKHQLPAWPLIQAKHFTARAAAAGPRRIRLIVLHTMEAAEKGDTAEAIARFFAGGDRVASAHLCVDSDSIVRCVIDHDVAWGAKGANHDGLHIEMAGTFRQSVEQWADQYSTAVLQRAAEAAAHLCLAYDVPSTHLKTKEIVADASGIVGHAQIVEAYPDGQVAAEHRDPGDNFPWLAFMALVRAKMTELAGLEATG